MDCNNNKNTLSPSYMINSDIRELEISAKNPLVRLCSNESPLGANQKVIKYITNKLESLYQYPDPNCTDIKNMLIKHFNISDDNIAFGNGSTELIDLLTQDIFSENGTAIMSEFSYPLYEMLVARYFGRSVVIPMIEWKYDLNAIYNSIDKTTKIIYLTNPNNPTGTWIDTSQLSDFIASIPKRIHVVIDEAYYDYMEDVNGYSTAIDLVPRFDNLIITRTFSKVYGLAGLRIGYAVAHPSVIKRIISRKQSANVNILAQHAAFSAFSDNEYKNKVVHEVAKNRINFENKLKYMKAEFLKTFTNFMLVKVKEPSHVIYKKLLRNRIIIQPMEIYGLSEYIRISIGTEKDMAKLLAVLPEVI